MSKEIEKLTYTEALKLVLKILDEHGSQIKSLDDRERLIQKTLERMAGEKQGRKEAEKEQKADWKLILATLGTIAGVVFGILGIWL